MTTPNDDQADADGDSRTDSNSDGPLAVLVDQFVTAVFRVQKTERLCVPADKNGEGVPDPDTHLQGYRIEDEAYTDSDGKRGPRVLVDNQFGSTRARLEKPRRLLVPTAKDLSGVPGLPDLLDPVLVDHFLCHDLRARRSRNPC